MIFMRRIEKLIFGMAVICMIAGTAQAQIWVWQDGTPGSDEAFDAAPDGVGGIAFTGLSNGSFGGPNQGSFDVIGGRIDGGGSALWFYQDGTQDPDSAECMCHQPDGNLVMGGGSAGDWDGRSNGGFDAVVVSIDVFGRERWRDQVGTGATDQLLGLDCADDGSTVGCGFTNGSLYGANAGGTDGIIAGWDPGGTNTWGIQIGTSGTDVIEDPWSLIEFPTPGVATAIVTGYSNGSLGGPNQGGRDVFVGSYNSDGSTNWTIQLCTAFNDQGSRLLVDANDNLYVTGHTNGTLYAQNAGSADAIVIKLSSTTGKVEWGRQLGSNQSDMAHAIASDGMGGILIAGQTNGVIGENSAGGTDAFIAHYDADGNLLSVRQFGTPGNDNIYGMVTDNPEGVGGNLLVAGSTTGSLGAQNAGGADVFVAKFLIVECPWDLDSSGTVGASDLLQLLANWGNPYGAGDLLGLLADWGACP